MKIKNKELGLLYQGSSLRKIIGSVNLEAGLFRTLMKEAYGDERAKLRRKGLAVGALNTILFEANLAHEITQNVEERMKKCGWGLTREELDK